MVPTLAKDNKVRATDYLIVADDDFINSSSLNNLVAYHTSQGMTVEVKGANSLNNSANDIKDYIELLYSSNELDYVLLVGDLPAIPHKADAYSSVDSDSWYSWIEGEVGDIGLGRLPATDQGELDDMVMKTLNFHNITVPGEWRKKSVLVAHRENAPGKYEGCSDEIYEYNYQLEAPTMDKLYGSKGATNDQVTDAINEGRIVVNYRGHGSRTAWTGWNGSSYSTSHVTGLENGQKTPVVFSICCTNGDMSSSSHCFAEAFICQDQGAVAILAANKPSYTTVNHTYDKALYRAIWDEGIEAYGDVRNYADGEIGTSSSAKSNSAMYITFGDPTINVLKGSSEPFATLFIPNGNEQWEVGTTQEIRWGDNISGEIKIEIFKGGSFKEVLAPSTPSDGDFQWQIPGDYTVGDDYKVKITSVDSTALNDDSDQYFSIIPEYIITCPYFQSFDTLESGTEILPFKYEQVSDDDKNWTVLEGPTPSREDEPYPAITGPMADHTTGGAQGNYLYTEASGSAGGNPDKTFVFMTPKFNFKSLNNPELSFWYHMYSPESSAGEMGDLILDISVDGTWNNEVIKISDDKGDNWLEQKLDLTPYKGDRVIFRFQGITGSSWKSDICIDDFKIDGVIPVTNFVGNFPVSYNLMQKGSRILFQVPKNGNKASHVSLKLYNLLGKQVSTLVNGTVKAGNYSIPLNSIDNTEQRIATGMYLCRMKAEGFTKTINILYRK
jgi:hypothetical protein